MSRAAEPVAATRLAGLAGIAVQSFVEFSRQMPGITALFVVVAAIAVHRPGRHDRNPHAPRV